MTTAPAPAPAPAPELTPDERATVDRFGIHGVPDGE